MDALTETERRTNERFEKQEDVKRCRRTATAEYVALCEELAPRLAEVLADKLTERTPLMLELRSLGPHVLAIAGLTMALESIVMERGEPETTIAIGRAVQGELWAHGQPRKTRTRIIKSADPRRIARQLGYNVKDWPRAHAAQVGNFLKCALLETLPDVFALRDPAETMMEARYNAARARKKLKAWKRSVPNELCITTGGEVRAAQLRERLRWRNPSFVPCTEPPKPWTGWRDGGYWDERTRVFAPFVRNCHHPRDIERIKLAFRDGTMKQHVDAVNALQSVAWTINVPVLEELKRRFPTFERKHRWHKVGNWWRKSKVPMVKVGKKWVIETLLRDDLAIAEGLVGKKFWTPLNIDRRGRVFGVCNFWYGRQDYIRALFLFADGAPINKGPTIDEHGLPWLYIHIANCWGEDKISLRGRMDWSAQHYADLILPTAEGKSDAWLEADQPFQFLAACTELVAMTKEDSWERYVTHLPIAFDCSCSGLQHLCAMTRSDEGEQVNLGASTPADSPKDIYRDVAELVAARAPAATCLGLDRKLMKLPTSTFAYNVGDFGINEQLRELIEERHGIDFAPPVAIDLLCFPGRVLLALELAVIGPARRHLWSFASKVVRPAIVDTVKLPAQAMEWLRECCANRATEWTTPSGLPWANRYFKPNEPRVPMHIQGRVWRPIIAEGYTTKVDCRRTKNSAAANLVHALDAAHLARTRNACDRVGIKSMASIHDSFACLASQAHKFHQTLREEFLSMYIERDPLSELKKETGARESPPRGEFNLEQVLRAYYFAT